MWIAEYDGLFQKIRKSFETQMRAVQWVRQCGKAKTARVFEEAQPERAEMETTRRDIYGEDDTTWSVSLHCVCPECRRWVWVDLLDGPDFWDGHSLTIPEQGTARTKDMEVVCPECGAEFDVDLEY